MTRKNVRLSILTIEWVAPFVGVVGTARDRGVQGI
jgi:hypothetical protein